MTNRATSSSETEAAVGAAASIGNNDSGTVQGEGGTGQIRGRVPEIVKSKTASRMYAGVKTWNPFKGCGFDCSYCVPSFQKQAKRQKQRCEKCYLYEPHEHPERLGRLPSAEIVFVCGNADISFCEPVYLEKIVGAIKAHRCRREVTYYLQSKRPECFHPVLDMLPENVVLVTTLETNRDRGYAQVSKAPPPSERFRQFLGLEYPRKVVTIEPVMDFDAKKFAEMITSIKPEYVWLGLSSRDEQVHLPEPAPEKLQAFAATLLAHGIEVRGKHFGGIEMPEGVKLTQGGTEAALMRKW